MKCIGTTFEDTGRRFSYLTIAAPYNIRSSVVERVPSWSALRAFRIRRVKLTATGTRLDFISQREIYEGYPFNLYIGWTLSKDTQKVSHQQ